MKASRKMAREERTITVADSSSSEGKKYVLPRFVRSGWARFVLVSAILSAILAYTGFIREVLSWSEPSQSELIETAIIQVEAEQVIEDNEDAVTLAMLERMPKSYKRLSLGYVRTGNVNAAFRVFRKGRSKDPTLSVNEREAELSDAQIFKFIDTLVSRVSFDLRIKLFEEYHDKVELSHSNRLKYAETLFRVGHSDDSANHYDLALRHAEKEEDFEAQVDTLIGLAKLDQHLNQWEVSKSRTDEALRLLASVPLGRKRARLQADIDNLHGNVELFIGHNEHAIEAYNRAAAMYIEHGYHSSALVVLANVALAYHNADNHEAALVVCAQVLGQAVIVHATEAIFDCTYQLSLTYNEIGDVDLARNAANFGHDTAVSSDRPIEQAQFLYRLFYLTDGEARDEYAKNLSALRHKIPEMRIRQLHDYTLYSSAYRNKDWGLAESLLNRLDETELSVEMKDWMLQQRSAIAYNTGAPADCGAIGFAQIRNQLVVPFGQSVRADTAVGAWSLEKWVFKLCPDDELEKGLAHSASPGSDPFYDSAVPAVESLPTTNEIQID